MKKRVLITGGAGFVASHTADMLKSKGYAIRLLDNLAPPVHNGKWPRYAQGKGYELIRGDVRKKDVIEKALQGISYVYHLAAYQDQRLDFTTFFETNVVSTAAIYETIVGKNLPVKKVILASSQFVYGDGVYRCIHSKKEFYPEPRLLKQFKKKEWDILCSHGKPAEFIRFKESQQLTPTNSYGLSKEAIERMSLRLGKTYNIPTTLFRYSIVQGPRQSPRNLYSGALRIFVSQALAGVPITVYEDGNATRDFVNVKDVVAANVLALTNKKTDFEVFNVGSGKVYTVLQFAKMVKRVTNASSEILVGGFRRTDTRNAVSDISKLKHLGWEPKYTSEEAVRDYAVWFKEEGFDKTLNKDHLKNLKKGITK